MALIELKKRVKVMCEKCKGLGYSQITNEDNKLVLCKNCNGRGFIMEKLYKRLPDEKD